MKVNWKVRVKNKVWLTSFFAAILTFVYTMLGLFDIYPEVTKNDVGEIINSILMFLSLMGVIVDPTTAGLSDSLRAMGYEVPYSDEAEVTEVHENEPEEQEHILDFDPEVITEVNVETDEPKSEGENGT